MNDSFLGWFAAVRLICLLISAGIMLLYFVKTCSWRDAKRFAILQFSFDQYWVLALLLMCTIYDEPLFEFRRTKPSIALAVLSEIPGSFFFTSLLTYWLMGLAYVRVKANKLTKERASLEDIVGILSMKRFIFLIMIFAGFVCV